MRLISEARGPEQLWRSNRDPKKKFAVLLLYTRSGRKQNLISGGSIVLRGYISSLQTQTALKIGGLFKACPI